MLGPGLVIAHCNNALKEVAEKIGFHYGTMSRVLEGGSIFEKTYSKEFRFFVSNQLNLMLKKIK